MKVAFVGAGNVAWHLAQAFENVHISITEVYSRNEMHAENLCKKLHHAIVKKELYFSDPELDILILAVSDDALPTIVKQIQVPSNTIVAHTSGSVSMDIFQDMTYHYGVFYPLQTFSKEKPLNINKVPFCIEGKNDFIKNKLRNLASSISESVYDVDSTQRKTLHVGAVFACNFVNHLLAISKNILADKSLDFNILKPLIEETIQKALTTDHPKNAQTGPAIRKDTQTIQRHLSYLQDTPQEQTIYQLLTDSIMHFYANKSE
jgi:predicted short-subunit dehydrogenase-like oxidoreductase (DUF2520 family)